jgi:hypothetical protein
MTYPDMDAFRQAVASLGPSDGGNVTPDEHNYLYNLYLGMFFGGSDTPGNKSLFRLVDELQIRLNELAGEGIVIDYDKLAVKVADLIAQRLAN